MRSACFFFSMKSFFLCVPLLLLVGLSQAQQPSIPEVEETVVVLGVPQPVSTTESARSVIRRGRSHRSAASSAARRGARWECGGPKRDDFATELVHGTQNLLSSVVGALFTSSSFHPASGSSPFSPSPLSPPSCSELRCYFPTEAFLGRPDQLVTSHCGL